MAFNSGVTIFPLQNPQATCAAYSQTWLALSLINGAPLLNPGIIGNQMLMSTVQRTAGNSTAVSLAADGLSIVGNPIVLDNTRWADAFWKLAKCDNGFYYLTIKNPAHAMACYVGGPDLVYYLEPEDSLSRFSSLGTFALGAAAWYKNRTGSNTNLQFKIYRVAPAPEFQPPPPPKWVSSSKGQPPSKDQPPSKSSPSQFGTHRTARA